MRTLLTLLALGVSLAAHAAPLDGPRANKLKGVLAPKMDKPAASVHFIDVDQGDATLIQVGPKNILIDSGPPKAAKELVAYLKGVGVEQVDLLINTHAHADHIGGARKLIEAIPIKAVLDPGVVHPSATYKKMIEAFEAHSVPVRKARAGREIKAGGAKIKVLAPRDPLFNGTRSDHNANSVVTRLDVGKVRFLFMGDAEMETEERLLHDGEDIAALVLKVAHHGSGYASGEPFLQAVTPRVAVISCGANNNYGHPNPDTIARIEAHDSIVLQTPIDGTSVIHTDGAKIKVDINPKPASARVKLVIDPNTADAAAFEKLPTVGAKLAARIVAYRDANGPFKSVDDLKKIKGLSGKRFKRMRPHLDLGAGEGGGMEMRAKPRASAKGSSGKININTADAATLETLPGVGAKTAARIVEHRKANGAFSGPDAVMEIKGIGPKKWSRMAGKVSFE